MMFRALLVAASLFTFAATLTSQETAMRWLHEPHEASVKGDSLTETVEPGTDYWRTTHYGFIRDNGPFYFQEQQGDFVAEVHVTGHYRELFHQAGLMVRLDEKNWIKTGIEYVEGVQNVSAVVTREFSDWSVVPRKDSPDSVWLRLTRKKDFVQVEYSFDHASFQMLRLAYFPPEVKVQIGMVAAAPGKQSFTVTFDHFKVTPLKKGDS